MIDTLPERSFPAENDSEAARSSEQAKTNDIIAYFFISFSWTNPVPSFLYFV
ncbi:hypothetical protein [Paucidesulfovibrio longus]|uniref:hypothetical protein n=1 Tax=Paucidesulfovibrio longus TaxID=889 RepID=UPI0012DDF18D|nr:hypothetical protein [Paucidesulfovibrio longus]